MVPKTWQDVLDLLGVEALPREDSLFQARALELVNTYWALFTEGFILENRERILKELTRMAALLPVPATQLALQVG